MELLHPGHVETLRSLYTGLATGDLATAAAALSPDTVLHVPGTGVNAGDHHGRDGVLGFVTGAAALTAGTLRLELERAWADDAMGVALATYRATRPGRELTLTNHVAHVVRFADGFIVEGWLQARDQYAVDAFWAG